jgi:hypothetical protein
VWRKNPDKPSGGSAVAAVLGACLALVAGTQGFAVADPLARTVSAPIQASTLTFSPATASDMPNTSGPDLNTRTHGTMLVIRHSSKFSPGAFLQSLLSSVATGQASLNQKCSPEPDAHAFLAFHNALKRFIPKAISSSNSLRTKKVTISFSGPNDFD